MSAGTDMRTSRAKVRGLGSAKAGTEHFIAQRVSAVGLVLLTPFFIVPFVSALGKPWEVVISIYKSPMIAIIAAVGVPARAKRRRVWQLARWRD